MRLIAHRGFASTAPENTVAAVKSAAQHADAVEVDVRRCQSGELVVIHDATIDRVTDAVTDTDTAPATSDAPVATSSLTELKTHTVLGTDERIPTLVELLEALPPGLELHLELKERGLAADVLDAIDGIDNPVLLTSFLPSELRAIRELEPSQSIGLLVSRRLETPVTTAVELDCDVIGASYWRCLTTRLVPRAKTVDLEIHAWPIKRRLTAALLGFRGVDCASADRPIRAPRVGLK
ncbi:glycerophosphodiester phosphodiesterase [Natrialba asiatica]|uniref:Glycerophosphoryl diester phosphodiesterase n=1 Tax=Natrialba asiatica (strain ATCC 700177 / DSM 12278 / JCM 9576 / FERM P-10747 / NBRC 102637 / 172P1) TaxID=29540 RepID=M0ANP9_NATA1|nr:glycerophosphodiester phosphodiesterase [Natrialba asiatica]ELZ00366.1 glycerophosphoryl diester phosphodiesterase [Natrialba asiatica DSM 12278]